MARNKKIALAGKPFTPRELDVVRLLVDGHSNKVIGAKLDISAHTTKFHVMQIIRKLDAENRTQAAVRFALRERDARGSSDQAQDT